MKAAFPILLCACFLMPIERGFAQATAEPDPFSSSAKAPPDPPARIDEKTAKENFKDFAKVYWHAEDQVIKGLKYGGASSDPDTFSNQSSITFLEFGEKDGGSVLTFSMKHTGDPKRSWEFEFSYFKSGWKATRGWETTGGKRQDLYKISLFSPIPYKPLVQIELDKYFKGEGRYGKIVKTEPAIKAPTYSCLAVEGKDSGAVFHFEWKGKRFIASIDESGYRRDDPKTFVSQDFDEPIITKRVVHEMLFYFQFHEYDSAPLDKVPPLTFETGESLKLDDPMFVHNGEEWVLGHVVSVNDSIFRVGLTEMIRDADRLNGSPIIHGLTGSVAGILYVDSHQEPVKAVDAARIRLPNHLIEESDSDSAPDQIFGVKRKEEVSPKLAKHVLKNLIYPEALKVTLGMTEAQLRATRPGLPKDFYQDKFTNGYEFGSVTYHLDRRSKTVDAISTGSQPSPEDIVQFFDFLTAYFGAPHETIIRETKQALPGPDSFVFFWGTDSFSMRWIIDREFYCDIFLDQETKKFADMVSMKGATIVRLKDAPDDATKREAMRYFFEKWLKTFKRPTGKIVPLSRIPHIEAEFERGGQLSIPEILRCRVRYFCDGAIFGSVAFVDGMFEANRFRYGPNRQTGARKMRGADWGELRVLRDLKVDVISGAGRP